MHKDKILALCEHFNLGNPINDKINPVSGGLLHRMWQIEAATGIFAIKELDAEIMKREGSHKRYNYTEDFAAYIASNSEIEASIALKVKNNYVYEVDSVTLMVYPWIIGNSLEFHQINTDHAYEIGKVIGGIHNLHANNKFLPDSGYEITRFSNEYWNSIISETVQQRLICSSFLEFHATQIKHWNNQYQSSQNTNLVISHRDIDPKNVLWKDGCPIIIDWESVGYIDPLEDLITTALNWSGITGLRFNDANFKSVVHGYYDSGSMINLEGIKEAFSNIVGGMLSWLEYNISRCINKHENYDINMLSISAQEITKTISTISFIDANRDNFLSLFQKP